jgi:hypothetical protein
MSELQQETGIARIDGVPASEESPNEKGRWACFRDYIWEKLHRLDGLEKRFIEAKVAQEENAGKKTANEAVELAAHAEVHQANARLINAQADAQLIQNLNDIIEMENPLAQKLAFARLMQSNPQLLEQFELVQGIVGDLKAQHGMQIDFIPGPDEQLDQE